MKKTVFTIILLSVLNIYAQNDVFISQINSGPSSIYISQENDGNSLSAVQTLNFLPGIFTSIQTGHMSAEIEQNIIGETAVTIVQLGGGNNSAVLKHEANVIKSVIFQEGTGNQVIEHLSVSGAEVNIYQSGIGNIILQSADAISQKMIALDINQVGNRNYASQQVQGNGFSGMTTVNYISQQGNDNRSIQESEGNDNSSYSVTYGSSNYTIQKQFGSGNNSFYKSGDNSSYNKFSSYQKGNGNIAAAVQTTRGDNNSIDIMQEGNGNSGSISQMYGEYNEALLLQTGNNNTAGTESYSGIQQKGSNNSVSLSQLSSGNSGLIFQIGNGNRAAVNQN